MTCGRRSAEPGTRALMSGLTLAGSNGGSSPQAGCGNESAALSAHAGLGLARGSRPTSDDLSGDRPLHLTQEVLTPDRRRRPVISSEQTSTCATFAISIARGASTCRPSSGCSRHCKSAPDGRLSMRSIAVTPGPTRAQPQPQHLLPGRAGTPEHIHTYLRQQASSRADE